MQTVCVYCQEININIVFDNFIALQLQLSSKQEMSKGFLHLEVLQFASQCFKAQKKYIAFKANHSNFTIVVSEPSSKIAESQYFPLAQNLQISVFQSPQDTKIGYFSLPLVKLYQYPKRHHIVKVNCAWMDVKNGNEVSPGVSAVIKLGIVYLKQVTATLNILVKNATLQRDTQAIGKMDPFVQCVVGDVTQKTETKDEAGKEPIWNQMLRYTLQSIPSTITFIVKDKDMTSDDIIGYATVNPNESKVFMQKQEKQLNLQLLYKQKRAGSMMVETCFSLNA